MNILIADDDPVSRLLLEAALKNKRYAFTTVTDGQLAWNALQRTEFSVLISDYHMPGIDGFDLTRRVRAANSKHYTYIILLTVVGGKSTHMQAIEAGADDFLLKPFDADVLYARLHVAERILGLRQHIKHLEGLLPICCSCKKIRDNNQWVRLEEYITDHSEATFTHGFCPECAAQFMRAAGLDPI
jgi:DNA-binding response OmpR family regulator